MTFLYCLDTVYIIIWPLINHPCLVKPNRGFVVAHGIIHPGRLAFPAFFGNLKGRIDPWAPFRLFADFVPEATGGCLPKRRQRSEQRR